MGPSMGCAACGAQVRVFIMKPMFLILSVALSGIAHGSDWKQIEGSYAITAENYLDPASDEPRDSHFRIQLRGRSARELYAAMKTQPVVDECTGALAKNLGEMQCLYFKESSSYECHFSIDLARQSIVYGVAC